MIVEYVPEQPKKEELFFVVKRKGEVQEESSSCLQSLPWASAQKREARPVLEADNPFMEAVCKGNVDLVRDLLQEDEVKGLINSTDGSGNTPMFHAVARGNANMANLLLKHGANHVPIGIRIHTAESTFRAADIGLPKNRKNTVLKKNETKKQRERRERMSEQRQISEWVRNMVCFRKQWAGQPVHKPRKARGVRAWQKNGGSALKPALSLKKGVSASEVVNYMFTPIAEEEEEDHATTHDEESLSDASCSDDDYEQEFNVEVIEGVSTLQEVLTAMEKEGHGVDPDYQAALLLALQQESEAMTAEKCSENQIVPASEEDWPALGGGGLKNAVASSSHTNCSMGDVQVVPASSKEITDKFEMVDGDESDDWEVLSRSNSNASLSSMTSWDDAGVSLADAPAGPLVEMCDKTEREAQSKWGMSFKDILRANVCDNSVPSVPKPVMPPIFFVSEAEEEREEGAVPKGEAWDSIVDGIVNGDIRINERDSAGEGRTNNQYHDHRSRPSKGQVRASRRSGGVKC